MDEKTCIPLGCDNVIQAPRAKGGKGGIGEGWVEDVRTKKRTVKTRICTRGSEIREGEERNKRRKKVGHGGSAVSSVPCAGGSKVRIPL